MLIFIWSIFFGILISFSIYISSKPKKLCKHEFELIDTEEKETFNGFYSDEYYLYTYQCKLCFKTRHVVIYK